MNECSNPIRKLTKDGENYIRKECSKGGKIKGKLNRPLPFTYPPVSNNRYWVANIRRIDNNVIINSDEDWGEYLIFLYNYFGQLYDIDPNILAAQAYIESHYVAWNYAKTSSASGISQFLARTLYGIVIKNKTGSGEYFNDDEKKKIIKNFNTISEYVEGDEYRENSYIYKSTTRGKYYREILHQNIMDNPDIMIKAQFRYMKWIATKCNNLASSSLFCYNRGPGFAKKTYSATVSNCENRYGSNYIVEGVNYVDRIYAVLGDKNGNIFPQASKYKLKNYSFGYDKYFLKYFNKDNLYEAKFYESAVIYNDKKEGFTYNPIKNKYDENNPFGCDLM